MLHSQESFWQNSEYQVLGEWDGYCFEKGPNCCEVREVDGDYDDDDDDTTTTTTTTTNNNNNILIWKFGLTLGQPFLTLVVRPVGFQVPYLRGATHAKFFVILLRC
jgi:hypothetical protein